MNEEHNHDAKPLLNFTYQIQVSNPEELHLHPDDFVWHKDNCYFILLTELLHSSHLWGSGLLFKETVNTTAPVHMEPVHAPPTSSVKCYLSPSVKCAAVIRGRGRVLFSET